jgi:hypothetical protein
MQIRKHTYFRFLITIVVLILFSYGANAQFGILKGRVTDKETKKPIPFASVVIEKEGKQIIGTTADFDGNYIINSISPDTYNLKSGSIGFKTIQINNLIIKADSICFQYINLRYNNQNLPILIDVVWRIPLIPKDPAPSGQSYTSEEINKMAW